MIVLAIETSCDETAVALVSGSGSGGRPRILSQSLSSQGELHGPYGGIVPELASRRHLEMVQPLTERVLGDAGLSLNDIEGVGVTYAPGLVGSLIVGLAYAKSLAYALSVPCVGVHHVEGHLHAAFLEDEALDYPFVGLVVSGGHTHLYDVRGLGRYELIGATRDDAAGEAFDKVARILGLGYPGGPEVDRMAEGGEVSATLLPRARLRGFEFSFSGLKSAVKNLVTADGIRTPSFVRNVCASFQERVVSELVDKTMAAATAKKVSRVVVSGGVACNQRLRELFAAACAEAGMHLAIPSPPLCTDNAAMIGYVGLKKIEQGQRAPLALNAVATLELARAP